MFFSNSFHSGRINNLESLLPNRELRRKPRQFVEVNADDMKAFFNLGVCHVSSCDVSKIYRVTR